VTVYNKGAEVIRMIETIIGKENFRKGMDLYFKRHDGQAVTTEDFVAAMMDASKFDLSDFKNWYNQEGTPTVSVTTNYDENQKVFHITVLQKNHSNSTVTEKPKKPFHIPLTMSLLSHHDGKVNELVSSTLQFKSKSSIFSFSNIEEKPVLSILRNFSAPVIIEMEQSSHELAFLMEFDTDSFNRWDAGQRLMTRIILTQVERLQQGKSIDLDTDLVETFLKAYKKLLLDENLDNALKTLALNLPDQSYLMDQLEIAEVNNIYQARKRFQRLNDLTKREATCGFSLSSWIT